LKETFYSNGKLLITGEYLVLDGAKAFAIPTKFGQNLIIEEGGNENIIWESFDEDGSIWFKDSISFSEIINKDKFDNNLNVKNRLIEILHEAYLLNPEFIIKSKGYKIKTELTFPRLWGLGTSSTLINNISQWLGIDSFELLRKSIGGSGYDIACAKCKNPIIYQLVEGKPVVKEIIFNPPFTDKLYFVYLNKKQSSGVAIASYYNKIGKAQKSIDIINEITKTVISTNDFYTFAKELNRHEIELSDLLQLQTVKELIFQDFNGILKSLGAWGGDFVMAISEENPTEYFKGKGYNTVIPYDEMILK
jgi:mevalonate kinase